MPALRPTATEATAAAGETQTDAQTEHLFTKVFPGDEPLVATFWTCPTCGLSVRGAPPRRCISDPATPGCPVETHPAIAAMQRLDNDGRPL